MMLRLDNARVVLPEGAARLASVIVSDGRFSAIGDLPTAKPDERTIDCQGMWFAPGLLDIQVNGGGGVLFNDNPSLHGLKTLAAAHRRLGTRWMLPTLISDRLEVIEAGIRAVQRAIESGVSEIIGIHIEGPFLNPERCGIHDPDRMLMLDEQSIDLLGSLKLGKTLVTLAPEQTSPAIIRSLTDRGVIVALGHSNASYIQTRAALDAGATGFTHLFNAMSPMQSREPGMVGAALADESAWSSIILDGHHVSTITAGIAFKSRPSEKFILITDSMPVAGTTHDEFELQGRTIKLEGGRCVDDRGTLAGADLSLPQAVRFAVSHQGIAPEIAIRMASQNPAQFLSLDGDFGSIRVGAPANGLLLNDNFEVAGELHSGKWTPHKALENVVHRG